MKEKILAVVLLVSIIGFSIANMLMLEKQVSRTIDEVDRMSFDDKNAEEKANKIYDDYLKRQKYMSITVSHDDLTNIEDCFVEMIAYLSVADIENAKVTKSRLISYLEHLRRLSGLNIDAII